MRGQWANRITLLGPLGILCGSSRVVASLGDTVVTTLVDENNGPDSSADLSLREAVTLTATGGTLSFGVASLFTP